MNKTTKNIIINGYIYASYGEYTEEFLFNFSPSYDGKISESLTNAGFIAVAPYSIEIEMPEDLDLHQCHLASLQNQLKLILAKNQSELNKINAKIQEFLAIENKS